MKSMGTVRKLSTSVAPDYSTFYQKISEAAGTSVEIFKRKLDKYLLQINQAVMDMWVISGPSAAAAWPKAGLWGQGNGVRKSSLDSIRGTLDGGSIWVYIGDLPRVFQYNCRNIKMPSGHCNVPAV